MYNGLFGDLPTTKQQSDTTVGGNQSANVVTVTKAEDSDEAKLQTNKEDKKIAVEATTKTMTIPRFVPMQMKRPRKTVNVTKRKKISKSKQEDVVVIDMSDTGDKPLEKKTGFLSSCDDQDAGNTTCMPEPSQAASSNPVNREAAPSLTEKDTATIQVQPPSEQNSNQTHEDHFIVEDEPEYLRELHEQAKQDLYDPMVPNDLLHYLEHQRSVREKERLLQEQRIALREHQRMRQTLEDERHRLQAEGDIDKIVEHSVLHQQGRKISNVPAWLLEQQRAQREGRREGA